MSLAGLIDAALDDPALATVIQAAGRSGARPLALLRRLRHPDPRDPSTGPLSVVVAPVRSILQPQVPSLGDLEPVSISIGDSGRELEEIVAALAAAGYGRTELVE